MNNEVIWLTGCASGVGLHLANAFFKRGYRLLATDINFEELQRQANHYGWSDKRVCLQQLDITSLDQWQKAYQQLIQRWGRLDRLFNIAGYLKPGYVHEVESGEIDRHIDINVKGLILGSQLAAKHMVAEGHGQIVNIASLAGLAPIPGIALYSTSKFAVRGFSLALAQELKPKGVYVTVICPDAIQTPMLERQEEYEEAALTFSGPKALSVEEIEEVIFNEVIPSQPMEVTLPWHRGALAKLGSSFPSTAFLLGEMLRKRGRKEQQKRQQLKAGRNRDDSV